MSFELLGRVQKEFSITSHALYETVLAIPERVNRKVQIMRLHWQATTLLARIDEVTNTLGQQIAAAVSPRSTDPGVADSALTDLDTSVSMPTTPFLYSSVTTAPAAGILRTCTSLKISCSSPSTMCQC